MNWENTELDAKIIDSVKTGAMDDEQPPTVAGAANNETELLPPVEVPAVEAWSDDDDDDDDPEPTLWDAVADVAWPLFWMALAGFVIILACWILTEVDAAAHRSSSPAPSSSPSPSVVPASALPSPPAPSYCAPGHNADRGCLPVVNDPDVQAPVKTMVPTPAAAPVTPAPIAAPLKPSQADLDERYLSDLTASGLRITDVSTVITGAHNVCRFLAAGHSESEAVGVAMRTNSSLTEANAHAMVDNAVLVYCPEQAD